jgi:Ca-activated chloride channel family protein
VFPLPPDSSVHEFTAHIGDRVVKGVIKKKGEAKTAFNEAVAHNQQAALLEQGNEEGKC